jgi:integrase
MAWDAVVPGLAVRVTEGGAKSFVLVARFPGSANPTARALGKVGAITLAEARTKGRDWLKLIAAGTDPAEVKAQAQASTLRAVCEEYRSREGDKLRSARWRRSALERLIYPTLGDRPIAEVRRGDIVRLHDRVSEENGAVIANRVVEMLRRIFNWYSIREEDFRTPIVRGMTTAEASRDRVLSDGELRAVWKATEPGARLPSGTPLATSGEGLHPAFCAYIRFLLLTACRRTEAAEMRWAEIADGAWTLPASRNKTGLDLVRPLSGAAIAILAEQPRDGEFVFSRTGIAGLGGMSRSKAALDRASGIEDWRLHDLRRTSRSLMSRAGVSPDHAEHCLGHVIGGVRGIYDRHKYRGEMAEAYSKLAALIAEIVR